MEKDNTDWGAKAGRLRPGQHGRCTFLQEESRGDAQKKRRILHSNIIKFIKSRGRLIDWIFLRMIAKRAMLKMILQGNGG